MQMKHLIILALIGIVILLGFNIINGNRHEQNRAVVANSVTPTSTTTVVPHQDTNHSVDVASQPLGKQPKAIMDNATSQINQAQKADQERLDQVINTQ
ncbi:hypothetical protein AK825_13735 [Psychrobacter sp. P11G5]|nr:hypothetical protein AK825_13735 [Psychrobacter sp. P11G5]